MKNIKLRGVGVVGIKTNLMVLQIQLELQQKKGVGVYI